MDKPELNQAGIDFTGTVDTLVQKQQMQNLVAGLDLSAFKGITNTGNEQVGALSNDDMSRGNGQNLIR